MMASCTPEIFILPQGYPVFYWAGAPLETLVLQHLRSEIDQQRSRQALYYWRTSTGLEVNFVLYGPDGLVAIEVKRKCSIGPGDLAGLRAFLTDYPEAKGWILYGGERRERFGTIEAVPIFEALPILGQFIGQQAAIPRPDKPRRLGRMEAPNPGI